MLILNTRLAIKEHLVRPYLTSVEAEHRNIHKLNHLRYLQTASDIRHAISAEVPFAFLGIGEGNSRVIGVAKVDAKNGCMVPQSAALMGRVVAVQREYNLTPYGEFGQELAALAIARLAAQNRAGLEIYGTLPEENG